MRVVDISYATETEVAVPENDAVAESRAREHYGIPEHLKPVRGFRPMPDGRFDRFLEWQIPELKASPR